MSTLSVTIAVLVGCGVGVATASEPPFVSAPLLEGWVTSARESQLALPHLSPIYLRTSDGETDVVVSVQVLGTGHPEGARPSGVVLATDWLPAGKDWRPLGNDGRCYQQASLTGGRSGGYAVSGQARCRGGNFVLTFTFFARSTGALAEKRWTEDLASIVSRTRTRAPCLTPEEQTFIADAEGPPYLVRTDGDGSVRVAAQPMCGTGGCTCFRFKPKGACLQLVLPAEHCDDVQ